MDRCDHKEAFDFDGNLVEVSRRLATAFTAVPDWSSLDPQTSLAEIASAADLLLETEAFTTESEYDALGRVISQTTPDDSETLRTYDEAGLVKSIAVKLRGSSTATPFVNAVDYDEKGRRTRVENGNGAVTTYEYDPQTFRLSRLVTERTSDEEILQDLRYVYDAAGNIVEIADAVSFGNDQVSATGRYEYDALSQLVKAEGREHPGQQPAAGDPQLLNFSHPNDMDALRRYQEAYEYDSAGNILEMAHVRLSPASGGWTRRYLYAEDSNRLLATSLPGDGPEEHSALYPHDAAGNMTAMPHLAAMDWDHANRLIHADKGGGGDVYFAYDAAGPRVRKVYEHSGLREERIYLGGWEVYRKSNVAGPEPELVLERETLHVADESRRLALVESLTVEEKNPVVTVVPVERFQIENHLGSSAMELDDAGSVISYEEYFPYGGAAFIATGGALEVSPRRYRYTGMERDEETGLAYHSARYYAPWLGRWTAADPAGYVDGVNLFRYSRCAPLQYNDVKGTQSVAQSERSLDSSYLGVEFGRREKDEQFISVFEDDLEENSGDDPSWFGSILWEALSSVGGWLSSRSDAAAKWLTEKIDLGESAARSATNAQRILGAEHRYREIELEGLTTEDKGRNRVIQEKADETVETLAKVVIEGAVVRGSLRAVSGAHQVAGQGFRSFSAFKRAMGPAGPGQHWHHIVEQTKGNLGRFGAETIHNTDNLLRIEAGVHRQVSGYYSSTMAGTGMTVRQWLSTQSLEAQREFGIQVLRNFGVLP